jgi:hypothetical protein
VVSENAVLIVVRGAFTALPWSLSQANLLPSSVDVFVVARAARAVKATVKATSDR